MNRRKIVGSTILLDSLKFNSFSPWYLSNRRKTKWFSTCFINSIEFYSSNNEFIDHHLMRKKKREKRQSHWLCSTEALNDWICRICLEKIQAMKWLMRRHVSKIRNNEYRCHLISFDLSKWINSIDHFFLILSLYQWEIFSYRWWTEHQRQNGFNNEDKHCSHDKRDAHLSDKDNRKI